MGQRKMLPEAKKIRDEKAEFYELSSRNTELMKIWLDWEHSFGKVINKMIDDNLSHLDISLNR